MNTHAPFFIGFAENVYNTPANARFQLITSKSQDNGLFKTIKRDESVISNLKIIVCGQKGAGKSALIYRIREKAFNPQLASSNRIHLIANAIVDNKKIWLRISDVEGTKDYWLHGEDEDVKKQYDAYATFILIKCTKKQKPDEIKLFITNKITEIRKNFPATQIVLVASESDKKFKTDSEILKRFAQELGCAGAAVVSAKDGDNIDSLMTCALQNLLPKPVSIKSIVPVLQKKSSLNLFQPTVSIATELTTITTPFVTPTERDTIIQKIDIRLSQLCVESANTFATDREIKIHKLLGIKELSDLVHHVPHSPIHEQIEYIREKYGKILEQGNPSQTKNMLNEIYAIATRNVNEGQLKSSNKI